MTQSEKNVNSDKQEAETALYFSIITPDRQEKLRDEISSSLAGIITDDPKKMNSSVDGRDCLCLTNLIDVMVKIITMQNEVELEMLDNFLAKFNTSDLIKMLVIIDKYRAVEKEGFAKALKLSLISALRKCH